MVSGFPLGMEDGARTPPPRMQGWIDESPSASEQFDAFRARGGTIKVEPDVGSPSYRIGTTAQSPIVLVDADHWRAGAATDAPDHAQSHLFGALVHELGHDRYNTTAIPFTGTTPDQYVDHRAGIEARAMFGAFEVAGDLEGRNDFERDAFFMGVGYLRGSELSALYADWRVGRLTDEATVEAIAAKVADAPYSRSELLQDQDGDGRRTHRDAYLRDYERYEAPSRQIRAPAPPQRTPEDTAHPDHALHDQLRTCVAALDVQTGKSWDDHSARLCAGVFALAREKGFTADNDLRVAFNVPTPTLAAGALVHVYRTGAGASPDPFANRAHMRVTDALAFPAEAHYAQAEALGQRAAVEGPAVEDLGTQRAEQGMEDATMRMSMPRSG